ncbi:phosphonatase-like hydrolase [Maribacter ulvicola]|uniref:Phosphonatase-like hydrolase n=1 Tax=Maribacter ulvicola TaxID=228959 RepID=A0A1N6RL85_9FLAO|nr:phosphonatase-like hydrolase [Maribacter ulvicola]SIQ29575.1 phosphonatase-like hydrolase [Maribacter ulvicola]
MHTIKLAVFDMAGTVVNEDNVVYKTLQKAINERGFQVSLDFVLEHGAGKEKHQAIKDIIAADIGTVDAAMPASIFKDFKKLLITAYNDLKVTSYDGVAELLYTLRNKGIKVALNTGYDTSTAQLLLDKMNWNVGKEYDVLVTADDVVLGRPNPDMIVEAMRKLNVQQQEFVLKAGDSIIDIEEGKNANCGVTIGVTTGAHTREQLLSAHPTYVLDSLTGLMDLITYG